MSQPPTSDSLRAWFRQVQPLCVELFNVAHLMCGNYDLAEYALRCAILDVWLESASGGMGFRERLRASLRREAFEIALSGEGRSAEFTWSGVAGGDGDGDPILDQLVRESVRTQRLVLLRHGCGLSPRSAAKLTGLTAGQVRGELIGFADRCVSRASRRSRARVDAQIARVAKKLLTRRDPDTPQISQIYRAFEAEADGAQVSGHRLSRVAGNIFLTLTALFCAAAFWLFAVLVQG